MYIDSQRQSSHKTHWVEVVERLMDLIMHTCTAITICQNSVPSYARGSKHPDLEIRDPTMASRRFVDAPNR